MVEEKESLKDGGIGLELLNKVCPGARFQALKLVEKRIRGVLTRCLLHLVCLFGAV